MAATKAAGTVRERLLRSADALFYREGIHVVGIDRILAHAGVAKASLYDNFKTKDDLVRAYLEDRSAALQARISSRIQGKSGRAAILAVFDDFVDRVTKSDDYCGCPFIRACAEGGEQPSAARDVSAKWRAWHRELFTRLVKEAGIERPAELARQLCFIYDGAAVSAAMDGDNAGVRAARKAAERLLPDGRKS